MSNDTPYNPLDKRNLGQSIAIALTKQRPIPLVALKQFMGAGVYMIYYVGQFAPYKKIAARNLNEAFELPIYVGKAVPSGSRIGSNLDGSVPEPKLYNRLTKHAASIEAAENLDVHDFYCRYLVVDDIWIPLGEQLAIATYSPIWNQLIDGFGNNDPGRGRYNQVVSKWDVLHPGRVWASRLAPRSETQLQIEAEVKAHLA